MQRSIPDPAGTAVDVVLEQHQPLLLALTEQCGGARQRQHRDDFDRLSGQRCCRPEREGEARGKAEHETPVDGSEWQELHMRSVSSAAKVTGNRD